MANNYNSLVANVVQNTAVKNTETKLIQDYLMKLMSTVRINSDGLAARLENILQEQNADANFFRKLADALASLFGMNIVKKGDRLTLGRMSPADENLILTIEKVQAQDIVTALLSKVDGLAEDSKQLDSLRRQMQRNATSNNQNMDTLRKELDSTRSRLDVLEQRTLHGIQRILAQQPELKQVENDDQDAFLLFLEDLGLTWSWDADELPEDFVRYRVSDPTAEGIRLPCLYRDGELVLKGLRYICDDASIVEGQEE